MAVLSRPTQKYWAIFKTQLLNSLAYPGDLLSRCATIIIFMWVFAQLWRVTYQAVGREVISGLTYQETLWYLMLAETIVLSKPKLSTTIAEAVKAGSVAYLLNKPYNFLLYQISIGLGDSVMQMAFNALTGGAIVWLLVGPPPALWDWPLVLVAVIAAWLIDFCIAAIIGLAAFITAATTEKRYFSNKRITPSFCGSYGNMQQQNISRSLPTY